MSSTNKTTNYELTQFLATDVPSWLVDYNGDMSKIDTGMHANAVAAAAAQSAAETAGGKADAAVADVAAIDAIIETPNTGVLARISSAENDIDTIQSLIGNGTPTTQDKTIIGAINELASEIPSGDVNADDVDYDNTSSGLSASNVQSAIDELKSDIDNITPVPLNRRVIVVADSYGTRTSDANFVTKLQTLLNLTSSDFYAFVLDAMGFSHPGGTEPSTQTCLEYMQAHASDVTSPATITDIVITLGLNDILSDYLATEVTAVNAVIAYCKTTYPNAKIHYGFIGNESGASSMTLTVAERYYQLIPLITNAFRDAGCSIIKGVEYVMHDARNFASDYIHPGATGATELSKFIYEHMQGLNPKYQKTVLFTNSSNQKALIAIDGETTSIQFLDFASMGSGEAVGGVFKEIFDLDGSPIRGMNYPLAFDLISVAYLTDYLNLPFCIRAGKAELYARQTLTFSGITTMKFTYSTLFV